jgi:hypothetical protein
MFKKEAASSGGIIELSSNEYKELVQHNPRPYDVVILWNVPPGRCEHCEMINYEFFQVAYSFTAERGREKVLGKNIFFVKMLFKQTDKEGM